MLAPSGPPTNFSAVTVGSDSVTLTWSAPDQRARNGIITSYTVEVMSFQSGNNYTLVTDTQNITIVNLSPYNLYILSVAARTAVGIGPFSTHLPIRTAETGETCLIASISRF